MKNTWYIILNNEDIILGIYEEERAETAREDLESLHSMFPNMARIVTSRPMERPMVGEMYV